MLRLFEGIPGLDQLVHKVLVIELQDDVAFADDGAVLNIEPDYLFLHLAVHRDICHGFYPALAHGSGIACRGCGNITIRDVRLPCRDDLILQGVFIAPDCRMRVTGRKENAYHEIWDK